MGHAAWQLVKEHYTWDHVAEMTEEAYFEYLEHQPGLITRRFRPRRHLRRSRGPRPPRPQYRPTTKMHPYTLIQLGMHSDASAGGVDRYFWGLNQGFDRPPPIWTRTGSILKRARLLKKALVNGH